jgi:hypothetical protein
MHLFKEETPAGLLLVQCKNHEDYVSFWIDKRFGIIRTSKFLLWNSYEKEKLGPCDEKKLNQKWHWVRVCNKLASYVLIHCSCCMPEVSVQVS